MDHDIKLTSKGKMQAIDLGKNYIKYVKRVICLCLYLHIEEQEKLGIQLGWG
ncbi:MAG: hypothetical protein Fur0010_25440 [Bdellovibrio sp.]